MLNAKICLKVRNTLKKWNRDIFSSDQVKIISAVSVLSKGASIVMVCLEKGGMGIGREERKGRGERGKGRGREIEGRREREKGRVEREAEGRDCCFY